MMRVADSLSKSLVQEKEDREGAEKRVAALEVEKERVDVKWREELEAKQSTIVNIQTHHAKQMAAIHELKEEVTQLKRTAEGSQREIEEWKAQVEALEKQVEAEKLEKQSVQENLQSERLALQGLKVELDESKVAHQTVLADAQSIETRLKFVTSEAGQKEVIEEYRQWPMGKIELSLAVKAGFDYLKAQLPFDILPPSGATYPPRVQSSLRVLQSLEARGAGVQLDVEDDDRDEDEDEDGGGDEDEDDDEGDGGEG